MPVQTDKIMRRRIHARSKGYSSSVNTLVRSAAAGLTGPA
jgi:hypothetical protein